MKNITFKMSGKIYAIIALSFVSLIGIAAFQLNELKSGLEDQKRIELRHLGEVAMRIVNEEYAAAQRGEISVEQAKKNASARIGALRYGADDYFWINDLQPRMIMHPIKPELNGRDLTEMKDPNGKHLFVEFADVVKRQGTGFVAYEWPKPGMADPQPKLSYVAGFQPWGWVIGTGVYIDDLQQQVWSTAKRSLTVGSVIIAFIGVVTVFSVRRMSTALKAMTVAMAELAAGNFDVVLPGLGRKDEIGDIATAVEAFKLKAIEKAHLETEADALLHQRETDEAAHRQQAEQELQMKAAEERAKAAEEIARVVRSLAEGLKSFQVAIWPAGSMTSFRRPISRSGTTSTLRCPVCRKLSARSSRSRAKLPAPRRKFRPAPPTFRSAPRNRPLALNIPPRQWKKYQGL